MRISEDKLKISAWTVIGSLEVVHDQFVKLISSKSSVRGGRLAQQRNERVYLGVWFELIRENIREDWLV